MNYKLLFVLAVLVPLAGCDKIKQIASLGDNLAATQKQVATLNAGLAATNEHVEKLNLELAEVKMRLAISDGAQASSGGPQTLPPNQIAALQKSIQLCIANVHSIAPGNQFYSRFDAYFDPVTGTVKNNVMYNGDMPALYAFRKCMIQQGFSL